MCVGSTPSYTANPKNNSHEGNSNHRIVNGIVLFAIHFKPKKMKVFEPVKTLSKNKASVDDQFIVDGAPRTVTKITAKYVYLDNNKYYMKKMFNSWMRIAKAVATRDMQSEMKNLASKHRERESMIMRKEAKAIYDEKYRTPAVNHMGVDTTLKLYIVLTGVGNTVKFYFSPTNKADIDDLELSYQSLHGVAYKAFAWGYYIKHSGSIALIGMYSHKERNLSEKRIQFAIKCLAEETVDNVKQHVKLYPSMLNLFHSNPPPAETVQLLSSTPASEFAKSLEEPQPTEKKHWSGLNGEIAQDMLDQGLNQMLDDDYPF